MLLVLSRISTAPHNTLYTQRSGTPASKPPFGIGHWFVLLVMGVGFLYAGGLLGNVTMWVMSAVTGYDYVSNLQTLVEDSPTWMTVLGACVIAPFGEELIFRKLLIDRVRGIGDTPAILLSGLLFALFHGNLFQLFYAFLVGVVLAYLYTRSGKYLLCVIMHAVINLLGSVILPELASMIPDALPMTLPQLLLAVLLVLWQYGSVLAAIVLLWIFWKRRRLLSSPLPKGTCRTVGLLLGNPGMIGCLVIMLLLTLSNLLVPLIPI